MKKLTAVLASVAALLAGPALAADLAVRPITKAPAYVPVMAAYNWSGFYVGGGYGGSWERIRGNFFNLTPTDNFNVDRDTGIGGVHGGVQWQTGMFVLGAEAGWLGTSSGWGSTPPDAGGPPFNCAFGGSNCQARINDIFYVGGKVGLAWDRFMVYGTGGYANAEIETRAFLLPVGPVFDNTRANHSGWFAGAGVDFMAWSFASVDVILGVDYKHFEFDDVNHASAFAPVVSDRRMNADTDVLMGRLTFKLNPWRGPIAASY